MKTTMSTKSHKTTRSQKKMKVTNTKIRKMTQRKLRVQSSMANSSLTAPTRLSEAQEVSKKKNSAFPIVASRDGFRAGCSGEYF